MDRRIHQLQEQFELFDKGIMEGEKSKRYRLEYCVQEYIKYKIEAEVTGVQMLTEKRNRILRNVKGAAGRFLTNGTVTAVSA